MIGFLFKKSFFDGYDNFWKLFLLNIGYGILIIGGISASYFISHGNLFSLGILVLISVFVFSVYSFGANFFFYKWTCYESGTIINCFKNYKGNWSLILEYTLFLFISIFVIPLGQYLYLSSKQLLGYLIAFLMLGFEIINFQIIQFYFPVCYYSEFDKKAVLKKSMMFAFDNPGYSIILILCSIFDLALTVLSMSTIPGIGGICISRMDTTRLLTERYQYLEEHHELNKKNAEWISILSEDIQSTGKRTLRTMLFPWKDA